MVFWFVVAAFLLIGLALIIVPVLRAPKEDQSVDRQQQNIDIARAKKVALDEQLETANVTQQEYDNALLEMQTALALDIEKIDAKDTNQQGKWVVWLLVLVLPLASIGLYLKIGEYRVIKNPALAAVATQPPQSQPNDMTLDQMVEVVKERLRDNPDDARGWFVLGKTMMEKGEFDEAVTAFQRTLDLVGDKEAGVLFSLADALSMQNSGLMQGEPEALILKGLEITPNDPTGLWLAGLAAEQQGDYKAAFKHMNALLPLVSNDAQSTTEVNRIIALLQHQDPSLKVAEANPQPIGRKLKVSVSLDEDLKQQVSAGDAVFIYAKAMNGPPMPLAVKRITVAELPIEVELSDADAMLPSMKLSQYENIIVGARVSKSGNPVAQAGDLYFELELVDSSALAGAVSLSISKIK